MRLTERDVTITPSIDCISTISCGSFSFLQIVFPFLIKMGEKLKSTSPNAIPLKNWLGTISIKEHLDVISPLDKVNELLPY
jgi:hypothetical protein